MFTFKQFSITQENTAMKVCTDSCLFGAITHADNPKTGLDIGAGTGLLSLMLAQKYPSLIMDAVEIDENALRDAQINISESKFKERIRLLHMPIQDFKSEEKYDLIISNPPFYENHLQSPEESKNLSHHSFALKNTEIIQVSKKYLKPSGSLWVILPPVQMLSFVEEASINNLNVEFRYSLRPNNKKPVFRVIAEFKFNGKAKLNEQEILICENGEYSPIFTDLLRDYYLIL